MALQNRTLAGGGMGQSERKPAGTLLEVGSYLKPEFKFLGVLRSVAGSDPYLPAPASGLHDFQPNLEPPTTVEPESSAEPLEDTSPTVPQDQ